MRRAKDFVTHHLGSTSFLIFSYPFHLHLSSALYLFASRLPATRICSYLFASRLLASRIRSSSFRISFTLIPHLLLISRISFTRIPHLLLFPSNLVYSHPESAINLFVSRLPASRICSSSLRISFTRIPYLLLSLASRSLSSRICF